MQRTDERGNFAGRALRDVPGHLGVDDLHDRRHFAASFEHAGLGELGEIVHVEQGDAVERRGGGVDVARDSDVDDEQRPRAAGRHDRGDVGGLDDHRRRSRGGEQHIGCGELRRQVGETRRPTLHPVGQLDAVLEGPIDDDDLAHPGGGQRHGHAFAHLTGAEHEHVAAIEGAEVLGRHGHRSLRHRRDVVADGGLGAGSLPHFDGVAEKTVDGSARGVLGLGNLPGAAHLAEHLALADDRGIEPTRHREQMLGRVGVVVRVEVLGELLGEQVAQLGERVAHVLVGAMEALGEGVHLGAVTGGQHHCLAEVRAGDERVQGFRQIGLTERHALKQVERHGLVIESDGYKGHAVSFDARRPLDKQ